MVPRQVAFQFPDKPSRNGAQPPVSLQGLGAVLRMVAEALVPVNPLEDESVALAQRKAQAFHDGQHLADNLFMQLRLRGVSHVLFLHGGVDERRPVMVTVIAFLVDTDALRQNQLHALTPSCLRVVTVILVTVACIFHHYQIAIQFAREVMIADPYVVEIL